ncbi:MAG: SCO family protein [Betaproteobacteria bacterium]|nr:SCO family protein [Betaproteobacteria bacterium]
MRRAVLIAAGLCAVALIACERPVSFHSVDVTGIQGYGNDFRLTDHTGKARSMADYRGKAVLMFFGFAQCPDVCPTTLADLKKVMTKLGPDAERFQVLFVTVDPARDTQDVLAQYVTSFHPSFVALRGDRMATERVTRDFKIVAQLQEGQTPETYTVNHSANSLVFDAQGRLRLIVSYGMDVDKLASDIQLLIKGK